MRVAVAVAVTMVAIGAFAACGGPQVYKNGATSYDAIIYLSSNVRDAQLYVDGHFIAPLAAVRSGIAVEPGRHRIELRRDDYFSAYADLHVARAERKKIALPLAAVLP